MHDDEIIKNLNRSLNKRNRIIFIAAIGIIAVAVIAVVIFLFFDKDKNSSDKDAGSQAVYDTTLTGDAEIDPENAELTEEDGSDVKADNLKEESGRANGIDVSKWQGKIDWEKVRDSGIEFAFIRIGYRGENGIIYKDDNADYNIQQAQKAGVLVGVYFFSTALSETEAIEEANWTKQAIEGYSISYPVVYDCEGFRLAASRMKDLTAQERTDNALAFLKTIKKSGYDAMFYSSLNDANDETAWDITKIEKDYKIWIAQYQSITYPQLEEPDYSGRCDAWQYTNRGNVNGISDNVDMVVCYFTKEKATPKNKNAAPDTAKAPLTEEEKLYTAVNEEVTAKEVVNLRKGPTTKSDIIATLDHGETATRIGIGKNGWSKLQYNGQIVYAITSYLTTDFSYETPNIQQNDIVAGNTFTPKNDRVTAKEVVNLRALPTTDSEIKGSLNSGEFLQRTAVSDKGWSRLNYNGQVVYAVTSYLSNEVVAQPEPQQPEIPSDGFNTVNEQVTAKEETNLRTAPSTENSEVVYTLKNGEYVKRIGVHTNGWSKLEYNGQTVYAISSYLTK